jgi:type II secretion system protein N
MAIHLGPTMRRVVRYLGFLVVGLATFVFALQLSFPYDRVKDKVIEALSEKYDVTIGDVERGFVPGRMYFKSLTLRTRPTKSDEVASTLYVEKLEIDLGLLALLRGTASVNIDAKIGDGHITGNIALAKDHTSIDLEGKDLPAASLPLREFIGLPMSGKLELSFELSLPSEKNKAGKVAPDWSKAEGEASFECPNGCVFGDGKTKLHPKIKNTRSAAFAEGGIEFGTIKLDTMGVKVEIKNGKLELTKFDTRSLDGELKVDFAMTLAPEISDSTVTGCLKFKGSPVLEKREAKTFAAIATTGAPLAPDGLFHIKLEGKVKDMKRLGVVCTEGDSEKPTTPIVTRQPVLLTPPAEPPKVNPPTPMIAQPPPPATPPPPPADAGVVTPAEPAGSGSDPAPGSGTAAAGSALIP